MGILDELRVDEPRQSSCSVCIWLESRTPDEQAEWVEAFTDKSIGTSRIWRAMKARGFARTDNPVRDHRRHDK